MIQNFRVRKRIEKGSTHFILFFLCISILAINGASWGADESFPSRPISMIVPWGAGGSADLGSKIMADRISEFIGQPVVSVYKPGGKGALGMVYAAKSKPDGYTIAEGDVSSLVIGPAARKVDYGPDDFVFVGNYANAPTWLVVNSDAPWKNLKEFVEAAKKSPTGFKICSFGKKTRADYVMELFNKSAGLNLKMIPYKNSRESLAALLGKHGDAAIATGAGGLVESGQIRILAMAEDKRIEGLPGIPTFKEFGYPDVVSTGLYTLCLPKGVSKEVYNKFVAAQNKAIEVYGKEISDAFEKVEIWADFLNPEETTKRIKLEIDRANKVAEELGWTKE